MTKKYLIEQIKRVYTMIDEQETFKNIEKLKKGMKNNLDHTMTRELGYIRFKYNKNRKLESATKETLLNLLDEYINYGFKHGIKGFDNNFTY